MTERRITEREVGILWAIWQKRLRDQGMQALPESTEETLLSSLLTMEQLTMLHWCLRAHVEYKLTRLMEELSHAEA
jgi:hypothetical protein